MVVRRCEKDNLSAEETGAPLLLYSDSNRKRHIVCQDHLPKGIQSPYGMRTPGHGGEDLGEEPDETMEDE